MTEIAIPPDYYVNYFLKMLNTVEQRYADILPTSDSSFLKNLRQVSTDALRLLIRLYLRKGPLFLANKLNYTEITDIQQALTELEFLELIDIDPIVFAYELTEILPISQSRSYFSLADPKIKKTDLIYQLFQNNSQTKQCSEWGVLEPVITPRNYETLRQLQLLYFGNERQSLTEFILEDIGQFKYERYSLSKENRLFTSLTEIQQIIQLNDLAQTFYMMSDEKQWDDLIELADKLSNIRPEFAAVKKWQKLANKLAYRLEQQGHLELALNFYTKNPKPPSRERRIRIYFKQGRFDDALQALNAIASNPLSHEEFAFYRRFINKVNKKLSLPEIQFKQKIINQNQITIPNNGQPVEVQAINHLGSCLWWENSLPLGIFGLIHWQIIFADIPKVWHQPFQTAPSDIYDSDFIAARTQQLEKLNSLTKEVWRKLISDNWHEKYNIKNPFVNWKILDLEATLTCFDALTKDQWLGIFNHLLSDLRNHRSGFPDLFQATESNYKFIEIKGPGDKLRDNQIQWLEVFSNLNINCEVCYVNYDKQASI